MTQTSSPSPSLLTARSALKEWGATCLALARGHQVVLLRKGGLLDEDGVFHLEHPEFYLLPTWLHQDPALVKPEYRDLLPAAGPQPGESRQRIQLRYFARVERLWSLPPERQEVLSRVPHIWSQNYLDLRYSYKVEAPLLCVALRVFELEPAQWLDLAPGDQGCRSWVEWAEPRSGYGRPVLAEAEFTSQLGLISALMG